MCNFCDGKIALPVQNINNVQVTATVKHKKYLYVIAGQKEYIYDLCFCPECGKRLDYYKVNKVYVSNVTKDIQITKDLHQLTCDIRFEGYKKKNKQIVYTLSVQQLTDVKRNGYCFVTCFNEPDENYE